MNEARFREAEARFWKFVGAAASEQQLTLARTRTTVRVQELGDGPPIVFVHGGSNSGASWAPLAARLEGFRCILLDRPGCGLSEPVETRFHDVGALARFADALVVDVLDALEIERAHVIATSFGGFIALRTAAAHPQRIDHLVELGWTMGAPIRRVPIDMRIAATPGLGALFARLPANERIVRSMFKRIGLRQALENGRVSDEMVSMFTALLRDTPTMRNEMAAGPRLITPIKGFNDAILFDPKLLGSISVPTFFLWGEGDPFGGSSTARAFVSQIPGAMLELMPGGHAVWVDDLEHVVARVSEFLTR